MSKNIIKITEAKFNEIVARILSESRRRKKLKRKGLIIDDSELEEAASANIEGGNSDAENLKTAIDIKKKNPETNVTIGGIGIKENKSSKILSKLKEKHTFVEVNEDEIIKFIKENENPRMKKSDLLRIFEGKEPKNVKKKVTKDMFIKEMMSPSARRDMYKIFDKSDMGSMPKRPRYDVGDDFSFGDTREKEAPVKTPTKTPPQRRADPRKAPFKVPETSPQIAPKARDGEYEDMGTKSLYENRIKYSTLSRSVMNRLNKKRR